MLLWIVPPCGFKSENWECRQDWGPKPNFSSYGFSSPVTLSPTHTGVRVLIPERFQQWRHLPAMVTFRELRQDSELRSPWATLSPSLCNILRTRIKAASEQKAFLHPRLLWAFTPSQIIHAWPHSPHALHFLGLDFLIYLTLIVYLLLFYSVFALICSNIKPGRMRPDAHRLMYADYRSSPSSAAQKSWLGR